MILATKHFLFALLSLIIIISRASASVASGIISKVLCKQPIKKPEQPQTKKYLNKMNIYKLIIDTVSYT